VTHDAHEAAAAVARDGYGRLVALLAAASGELDTAQDALGDALERALRTWPRQGVPDNPHAWLLTVARNRLRDRWRSAEVRRTRPLEVDQHAPTHLDDVDPDAIEDKRLALMLVCAHPAIAEGVRAPLMLTAVLGFTAEQIARAFAVPRATMATRLVRAKRRIKAIGLSFELPDRTQLPPRLDALMEAVYGAHIIEWATSEVEPRALPPDALQLSEVLAGLVPDDAEVRGLAALVLLSAARTSARTDAAGCFVPLAEQDPARWDGQRIARAHEHLRAAHRGRTLGRFQLEAAIQATHCARRDGVPTDWSTLERLHEALHQIAPSLGSATALAAVLAETRGPTAGLQVLDALGAAASRFQPAWATRAELLARLGHLEEAARAYDRAIALTVDTAHREHLNRRRDAVATMR
jgi:predicted RNA polymerase sigma factor